MFSITGLEFSYSQVFFISAQNWNNFKFIYNDNKYNNESNSTILTNVRKIFSIFQYSLRLKSKQYFNWNKVWIEIQLKPYSFVDHFACQMAFKIQNFQK